MTETERLLQRQAEWQKARQAMSWSEKIRQAEHLRSTIETLRAERERRARLASSPPASSVTPPHSTRR
jgi:hypothetical protein